MFKSFSLIFIALFVQDTLAQVVIQGNCPDFQVVGDFQFSQFIGEWFGYAKFDFAQTSKLKCNRAIYRKLPGSNNFEVENIGVGKVTNQVQSVIWQGIIIDNGRLSIAYDSTEPSETPNFNVLGTDYQSYAAVFNCRQRNETHNEQTAFLLTREQFPQPNAVKSAQDSFTSNGVHIDYLVQNDQTDCPNEN